MMIAAAAQEWNLPTSEITITKGIVGHASSVRRAAFGELAEKAAALPVPSEVKLKEPKDWIHIGKHVPRIDSVAKTTGAARYALDVKRPGMLTAVVARSPRFGGVVKSFDASGAKAIDGVVDVVSIGSGVAVLARDTWSAIKGREAVKVEWDDSKAEVRSSDKMLADYRKLAKVSGRFRGPPRRRRSRPQERCQAGRSRVHVSLPRTCAHGAAQRRDRDHGGRHCRNLGGFSVPDRGAGDGRRRARTQAGTGENQHHVGRRLVRAAGHAKCRLFAGVALIAKATAMKAPVHLVWTREDDIRGGRYRPMVLHKVRAALDASGHIVAWDHHIVAQSFITGTAFEPRIVKNGVDRLVVEGTADMPYQLDNLSVDWHQASSPVTTLWWRSVGHTHTAQVVEVMMDVLANEAKRDPVEFRLSMLKGHPRHTAVLKLAAEKGGWGRSCRKAAGGVSRFTRASAASSPWWLM